MPKIIIVIVILVVAVGGIYFWQNRTVSETNSQIPDQTTPKSNYINTNWNFSLDIPEGYLVRDDKDILYVVKKPAPDNETPSPEMKIKLEKGSQTTLESDKEMKVVSEEEITINSIKGHKTVVSYSYKDYPEGNQCPVYRLQSGGVVYEFSLYECLETAIFESVVQSFRVI